MIDHFDMALTQDPAKASAQQIIDGVKVIREELLRSLTRHGVTLIQPQANEEFAHRCGQAQAVLGGPFPAGQRTGRDAPDLRHRFGPGVQALHADFHQKVGGALGVDRKSVV